MKKAILPLTLAAVALAQPALAARVTNLDNVPYVVTFEQAGTVYEQTVQPQRTAYFTNADGIIGLKGGTPARSTVTSDGMLQGVIGAQRTSRIPAGPGDDFVIWKGGQMHLQRRIKAFTNN